MNPERSTKAQFLLQSIQFQHQMLLIWDQTLQNYYNLTELKLEELKKELREYLDEQAGERPQAMMESTFENIRSQFSMVYEEKRSHLAGFLDNLEYLAVSIDPVQAQPEYLHLQDLRKANPLHPRVTPGTTFEILRAFGYCQDSFQQLGFKTYAGLEVLIQVIQEKRDQLQKYYGKSCIVNLLPFFSLTINFLKTLKDGAKSEIQTLKAHLDLLYQPLADLNETTV